MPRQRAGFALIELLMTATVTAAMITVFLPAVLQAQNESISHSIQDTVTQNVATANFTSSNFRVERDIQFYQPEMFWGDHPSTRHLDVIQKHSVSFLE